jgi:hypothetical protein
VGRKSFCSGKTGRTRADMKRGPLFRIFGNAAMKITGNLLILALASMLKYRFKGIYWKMSILIKGSNSFIGWI